MTWVKTRGANDPSSPNALHKVLAKLKKKLKKTDVPKLSLWAVPSLGHVLSIDLYNPLLDTIGVSFGSIIDNVRVSILKLNSHSSPIQINDNILHEIQIFCP